MPSSQEYAARLREDAHRMLAPQVNDLEQELNNIRNDLTLSLGQLGERLDAIRNFALSEAETVVIEALEELAREKDLQLASIARFGCDIRRKETQQEILDFLLDEAAKFSSRVSLFVIRGRKWTGWSSRGFSQKIAEEISNCAFEQAASPLIQKALESETHTTATEIAADDALNFVNEEATGSWHSFPLKAMGRPVAFVLAATAEKDRSNLESLRILLDLTGTCIENIALRILHELRPQPQQAPPPAIKPITTPAEMQEAESAPAEAGLPTAVEESPALEPAITTAQMDQVAPSEEQIALDESVTQPATAQGFGAVAPEHPEVFETGSEQPVAELEEQSGLPLQEQAAAVMEEQPIGTTEEQFAAPPLEEPVESLEEQGQPVGAVEEPSAQVLQETPAVSLQEPTMVAAAAPTPETVEPIEPPVRDQRRLAEEVKQHADAKRFARLLVSEIKLYNEQRVIDGRHNKDIYVRLKKDIDKSREMYDKRVPVSVTRKIDYFHDEVIRILGENDPSALGSDYPGPRVES